MTEHLPTPRLSHHARERCKQMGVSTKRVKRILSQPTMTYTAKRDSLVAWSAEDPEIAVVYAEGALFRLAVTVIPRTDKRYEREG